MFSAPKLLIILGLIFLLILLPAMAGISLIAMRRTARKITRGPGVSRAPRRGPETFLR
jgi:hypothetical protein